MDQRFKVMAAFLGLLTAIVVLVSTITGLKLNETFVAGEASPTLGAQEPPPAPPENPENNAPQSPVAQVPETTQKPPRPQPMQTTTAPLPKDTCIQGYVWREAFPGDHVCVLPATRNLAHEDNLAAGDRIDPTGAYGPKSCINGYVWRVAVPDDLVCVLPQTRDATREDNRLADSRRVH
jgi:hypothetical protein